jgi:serine/threonine-protein kinase RsbW
VNVGRQNLENGQERDLHFRVPAAAGRLAELRHALAEWATGIGLSDEDTEALVLSSYEAMANSVEHAYRNQTQGVLDLLAQVDDGQGCVVVTVTDYGQWKTPQPSGGLRGRGLSLIKGLTTSSTITPTTGGTTVSMAWALSDDDDGK